MNSECPVCGEAQMLQEAQRWKQLCAHYRELAHTRRIQLDEQERRHVQRMQKRGDKHASEKRDLEQELELVRAQLRASMEKQVELERQMKCLVRMRDDGESRVHASMAHMHAALLLPLLRPKNE